MAHTHFCKHAPLRRSLIAILAGVTSCAGNADGAGSAHWQDLVMISGSPTTSVTAGQAYSFAPSATGTASRTLAFAITNKPSWMNFSSSTGQLSGTPSGGSVGTYPNIVIGVSDGWKSATLPAFTIQVLARPLAIFPGALSNGVVGTPYNQTLQATGGVAPFAWTVSSGALPRGLSLSNSTTNTVTVSGTPDASTQGAAFTIQVADTVHQTATKPFTVSITPSSSCGSGCANAGGNQDIWLWPHYSSADFLTFFDPSAPWSQVAPHINVVGLSIRALTQTSQSDLNMMLADLRQRNMSISLDMLPLPGGGPTGCGYQVEGYSAPGQTRQIANNVKALGSVHKAYSMDEPLYYGHFYTGTNACQTDLPTLIQQVAQSVRDARSVFPGVEIGETEPIPAVTQGGLTDLSNWLDLYQQTIGEPLGFMTLDMGWRSQWSSQIPAVISLLHSKGVAVHVIYNGGSATSDGNWTSEAVSHFQAFEAIAKPDAAEFMSWNPYPTHMLPDSDPTTLTGLVNGYIHYEGYP